MEVRIQQDIPTVQNSVSEQEFAQAESSEETSQSISESKDSTEQLKALANQVAEQVTEQVTEQVAQRLTDRIDETQQNKSEVAPANAVTESKVDKNYREMEVITPDGVIRYVWKTRESEPVIIAEENQETKTSQNLNSEPAKIALQK